jgi:ATP-dependent DNA helicase RecG
MREGKTLEFKSEITNTFLKTVCAYANFGSGEIRFGVNDDGSVRGMHEPAKACLDIENKINDNISPKPEFALSVNRKSKVITLTVMEGLYKPYLFKGKAFRRSDTATIEVDAVELKRLVLEGMNMYYEMISCGVKDLQFQTLTEKFREKLNVSDLSDDVLRTIGFFTDKMEYNNAAAIFADKNHFYGIDIVRFGKTINEILDRETIAYTSILKQYDMAVALYRKYYQYEKIEGMDRKLNELIPETAFRETIANALVHRTWDVDVHIRVSMFADRIEITSPGGLPGGVSQTEYLHGYLSKLRNPIIGNVFFRLHYIEMFGTGVRRILDAYSDYLVKPVFTITENAITISLPITTQMKGMTPDEEQMIQILSSGMNLASSEIVELSGYRKDKVLRLLNSLVDKNYVRVIGEGRGTKYTLMIG